MYADDIVIYFGNPSISFIIETLTRALNDLARALRSLNLSISPQKTQFCLFFNKSHSVNSNYLQRNNLRLKLGDDSNNPIYIPLKPHAKFLGMIFDGNLSWQQHVKYIKGKIAPRINILKAISGIGWGAHPSNLIMVYKGLIRPILDWGCQVLNDIRPNVALQLDRLQFAALRVTLRLVITTPTNVILHLCGELPLHIRRCQLSNKYLVKACAISNHPLLSRFDHLKVDPA